MTLFVYNTNTVCKLCRTCSNSSPNDKVFDQFKFKELADDKINENKKIEICFGNGRKHFRKRRKCWLSTFSPFPTMFSKASLLRVIKSWDCVVKS